MKKVLAGSIILLLMSFVAQSDPWSIPENYEKKVNPVPPSEKSVALGKKVYKKMCWSCHGDDGKGNGPASTSLNPKPADFSSDQFQNQTDGAIFWKLSTGRGAMAPFENSLSVDQRWSVVNYLRTFKQ